eukprot:COSAG01_NODE_3353_length_6219_cov_30.047059_2_plen_138_part_00
MRLLVLNINRYLEVLMLGCARFTLFKANQLHCYARKRETESTWPKRYRMRATPAMAIGFTIARSHVSRQQPTWKMAKTDSRVLRTHGLFAVLGTWSNCNSFRSERTHVLYTDTTLCADTMLCVDATTRADAMVKVLE